MLRRVLTKGFDRKRLQALLAVIFLALALPTGLLIWHAYSQLKWEAFHQYRTLAEELSQRIDTRLINLVNEAEAHSFADYAFYIVTGDPGANYLQRSSLAEYPVADDWPGLVGYFQIDTDGKFSTPLLPQLSATPETTGLTPSEYAARQILANNLRTILSDNRLVPRSVNGTGVYGQVVGDSTSDLVTIKIEKDTERMNEKTFSDEASSGFSKREDASVGAEVKKTTANRAPASQQAFDSLSRNQSKLEAPLEDSKETDLTDELQQRSDKVADLNLDSVYEQRSAKLDEQVKARDEPGAASEYVLRQRRKEKTSLPEPVLDADADLPNMVANQSNLRINTFVSELDPLEFSLLDNGQMVLFRNVWREGERYIQGMLLDQQAFIRGVVDNEYRGTALSNMSDLILANQNDVLHTVHGDSRRYDSTRSHELAGTLLYRNRLSAPFSTLELIFSVNRLPPGPGASVLGWVTLLLAMVFAAGFYALYRAGLGQITLVQQQHDFVSAVSHELKTPLTSIRMYGEMLKQGWADDEKKQTYYNFIHDESERLTRLISNVLQLANISRADPQIKIQTTNVHKLMNTIESKVAHQVQQAEFDLEISCDREAQDAVVKLDEDCFTQVIINLFDNAIKFSRDASLKKIELSAQKTSDGKIVFSVRDYGPGIAKDQMEKIFEMFFRSESELTRETVGTGIGLAIVHQLTKAMHGNVDVMNRNPGAEFRVTLPMG